MPEDIKRKSKFLYNLSPTAYNFGHLLARYYLKYGMYLLIGKVNLYNDSSTLEIRLEYENEMNEIERFMELRKIKSDIAVSYNFGRAIYSIIRERKPNVVFETGVANGLTTRLILSALNKNKKGKLISVEVSNNVGVLLDGFDKSRWSLITGEPKSNMRKALKDLKEIDIFIHDSDHSYENMKFEFDSIYPLMSKNGIIMSDDIDTNSAFIEFSDAVNRKPFIVLSKPRCSGIFYL